MTDIEMWSLLVGFASPVAIGVIQQPRWSDGARASVAFVFCAVVSFITYVLNGGELKVGNWREVVTSILIVLVSAVSTYKGFWKPTGIVPGIEVRTSPKHAA